MLLQYKCILLIVPLEESQCQSSTGFSFPLDADWSNTIVAGLALAWSMYTFVNQNRKNRDAEIQGERLRQQTIRLDWFRDAIKGKIDNLNSLFNDIRILKNEIKNPNLTSDEVDSLMEKYKVNINNIREEFLERLLYVDRPTYDKLKNLLDDLTESVTNAIINDQLKLSNKEVYEREIGKKINSCQESFYTVIYSYRGEGMTKTQSSSNVFCRFFKKYYL